MFDKIFEIFHVSLNRSVAFAAGAVRVARGVVYATLVAGVAYGLDHFTEFNIPTAYRTLALVLLLGVDKYLREHHAQIEPEG
jgi:hypothetical protein